MTLPSWLWSVRSEGISLHHWLKVREEWSWAATLFTGVGPRLHPPWPLSLVMGTDEATGGAERGWLSQKPWRRTVFHHDFPPQHYIVVSPASFHKLLVSTLPVQWSFHFHLMLPLHLSHFKAALSGSFSRRWHYDITFKCCSFYFPSSTGCIHQGGVKLAKQMRYITSDLDSGSCLVYWSTFSPFFPARNHFTTEARWMAFYCEMEKAELSNITLSSKQDFLKHFPPANCSL